MASRSLLTTLARSTATPTTHNALPAIRRAAHHAALPSYTAVYRHFATVAKRQDRSLAHVLDRMRAGRVGQRQFTNSAVGRNGSERNHEPRDTTPSSARTTAESNDIPTHPPPQPPPHHDFPAVISTYLPSIRRLAAKLPHLRRPPTAAELLPFARSWWSRFLIRLKWFTIRSFRPYRTDDYTAFASLFIVANLVLLVVGTTTFLGVVLFIFNKAGMEDRVARWLSGYMTGSTGVSVVFESAVVPRWRGGMIRFENVYISRGELGSKPQALMNLVDGPIGGHANRDPETSLLLEEQPKPNATSFHLTIASVDVTLSLRRWLDGKGLIRAAVVKGVRGVVDRSHLVPVEPPPDRASFRRSASVGDFWLEGMLVEDLLVTICQPNDFRPYTFSIFNANIGRLRKQWLFLDLLSAESVTGQVDNCLFSLHRPQSISRSNNLASTAAPHTAIETASDRFETRLSRFRIDGVPIDHVQTPQDSGTLSWITSGKVDLVADICLPRERDEVDLGRVVREIVDNFEKEVAGEGREVFGGGRSLLGGRISERPDLARPPLEAPSKNGKGEGKMGERVVIDMDIRFKDVKASLPVYTSDLSYVNNALIRPIVAFINANRTLVPIKARVDMDLSEFDGSWTSYDVGIIEVVSEQVYAALAHHVSSQSAQSQRLSKVGIWGVQLTANAVLEALKGHLATVH